MGQGVSHSFQPSVNPLVYIVKLSWTEPVSGKIINNVWNLLQGWAAKNDCVPEGDVETTPTSLVTKVIVKRRMGPPRDDSPW